MGKQDLRDRYLIPTLAALGKCYTSDQAAALLDQARLRQKAVKKFGAAAQQMLFVDEALQQASGQAIARYRAARYASFAHVADLGCGIGGDALALGFKPQAEGANRARLLALELDSVRALFAEHNLRVAGGPTFVQSEVVQADWTTYPFPPSVEAAFADPARRVNGRRVFSLHQMQPSLGAILAVQRQIPHMGVKVMPSVRQKELPLECEVEWITENGTCKEAVLWFGSLRTGAARTATVLQKPSQGASRAERLTSHELLLSSQPIAITPPRAFLWEPDPSVIRATLVAALAHQLHATQLDKQIAYLTSDAAINTPFARCWAVIEHAPFHLKTLKRRLRALNAHVIAVKKRGSPIEPEPFRRRLKSNPQGQAVTLFLTKHKGNAWMIICGEELRNEELRIADCGLRIAE
ncbi:MAG: class I SAM-dependent methyltransferase [Ardenticatenaceae bacterium]